MAFDLSAKKVYAALEEDIKGVDAKIDDALIGLYYPGGSVDFSDLPELSADVFRKAFIVTDAFTTTSDFVEGSGTSYPAGTNVAVVNTGTAEDPVYKFDVVPFTMVIDSSLSASSENPVQNKIITAKTQAIELAISQLSASVLLKAPQTEVDEIKLDISNLSASKASKAEVQEIALEIADLSASTLIHKSSTTGLLQNDGSVDVSTKPTVLNTIYEQKKFTYSDSCYRKTVAIELPDFNRWDFYVVKTWMKGASGEPSEYDHRLIRINDSELSSTTMSHSSNKVSIYTDSQTDKNMIQVDGTAETISNFYMEITVFIKLS